MITKNPNSETKPKLNSELNSPGGESGDDLYPHEEEGRNLLGSSSLRDRRLSTESIRNGNTSNVRVIWRRIEKEVEKNGIINC